MPKTKHTVSSRAIGRLLKTWREEKGLSLRQVAYGSKKFHEPIGFDYLSRLERGLLMPSVPKLATLASVYGRQISELIDLYEVEILRRLVPKRAGSELCRRLGLESLEKGEIMKAQACFLGALDAARREKVSNQRLGSALNDAGYALMKARRYLSARQYLEEGLRFVESPASRVSLLDNLANAHRGLGNLILADLVSREACTLAPHDASQRPRAFSTRAAVLIDLGRTEEAEQLLRTALEESEKTGNNAQAVGYLDELGQCLVAMGKIDEGLAHLRAARYRALRRRDQKTGASCSLHLGKCLYAAGQTTEAIVSLTEALRLGSESDNHDAAFHSAFYLWRLAESLGSTRDAALYESTARGHRALVMTHSTEAEEFDARADPGRTRVTDRTWV